MVGNMRGTKRFETAFEADRLSAAFSGEKIYAGLAGVCGNLPDCDNCELCLVESIGMQLRGTQKKWQLKKKYRETKFQLQIIWN